VFFTLVVLSLIGANWLNNHGKRYLNFSSINESKNESINESSTHRGYAYSPLVNTCTIVHGFQPWQEVTESELSNYAFIATGLNYFICSLPYQVAKIDSLQAVSA
jgi:hypothetical protein